MNKNTFKYFHMNLPFKSSTNSIYSGKHMTERINEQRLMHWAVKSIKSKIPRVENFPVSIHFHFKFVSHPLDSSNCSYMAKLIEDALEREGILPKDNIKYVKGIYLESMKGETLDMVTVKFKEDKK